MAAAVDAATVFSILNNLSVLKEEQRRAGDVPHRFAPCKNRHSEWLPTQISSLSNEEI